MLGTSAVGLFKTRQIITHKSRLLVILAVLLPAPFVYLTSEPEVRVFNGRDGVPHILLCVEQAKRFIDRPAAKNTRAMAVDTDDNPS